MLSDFTPTCPLNGAECTDTCAWADVVVTISDDGIERETFCAVAMAAAALMCHPCVRNAKYDTSPKRI